MKGDDSVKTFFISMGIGLAVGALGVLMLPKTSGVYRTAKDTANTIKREAEKLADSVADGMQ